MEESQKYKEGKFIVEKAKIMKVGLVAGSAGAGVLLYLLPLHAEQLRPGLACCCLTDHGWQYPLPYQASLCLSAIS